MSNSIQAQPIAGRFKRKDILSLDQFSPKDLLLLFKQAKKMKTIADTAKQSHILSGAIITLLFYEPSSRTFGSFSSAAKRLGGQTLEFQNPQQTSSVAKGETLSDTIQTVASYSELIVLRHPEIGSAQIASDATDIPLINAGDGKGEHPTQALLDLFTLYEHFGRLDNLTIVFGGDMLNGRTVHSLLRGLALFKHNHAVLLSPPTLRLSKNDYLNFSKRGTAITEIENERDIPKNAHAWYWTRVQKERFSDRSSYEKVKNKYIVTKDFLNRYGNKDMVLMHPLPRVGEITQEVDEDPRAIYIRKQMKNGVYIRMALLALVLGKIK